MDGVAQESAQLKEEKFAFWRRHQLAWEASGLSRTAYCQRENLKLSSFDYQRARLRAMDAMNLEQGGAQATKKTVTSDAGITTPVNRFIPATCPHESRTTHTVSTLTDTSEMIHVQTPDGWHIQLSPRQIIHHSTVITALFQLLGRSP